MFRKVLILFIAGFGLTCPALKAQVNTATVDQKTYEYYVQEKWDLLIQEGKKAIDNGIDFYFLRVRLGTAYFKKGNYHKASQHLERAASLNPNDDFVNELLYFSYLYSGLDYEAKWLAKKFSDPLKEKLDLAKKKKVEDLEFHYSYSFSEPNVVPDPFTVPGTLNLPGAQFISRNQHIGNLFLTHFLSPKVSIHHGYTYIRQDYFVYARNDSISKTLSSYLTHTHQYFIRTEVRLAKKWLLGIGVHLLYTRYPLTFPTSGGFGMNSPRTTSTGSETNAVLNVNLTKHFRFFSLDLSGSYANLNQAQQLQGDFCLSYYPLGNLNLYGSTRFTLQEEYRNYFPDLRHWGIHQDIGVKVCRWLWADAYGHFGVIDNLTLQHGLLVYNSMNPVLQMYGMHLSFLPSAKIRIHLNYEFTERVSTFNYQVYQLETTNEIHYFSHQITGGLIWKF